MALRQSSRAWTTVEVGLAQGCPVPKGTHSGLLAPTSHCRAMAWDPFLFFIRKSPACAVCTDPQPGD